MTIGLAGLSTAARKENRVQRLQAAYFVSGAQSPTEKCAAGGFWTLFFFWPFFPECFQNACPSVQNYRIYIISASYICSVRRLEIKKNTKDQNMHPI